MFDTLPAKIVFGLYATLILFFAITILYAHMFGIRTFVIFIFFIANAFLNVYNIDCLAIGNCIVWQWIHTIILSLGLILLIVIYIVAIVAWSRSPQPDVPAGKKEKETEPKTA